jgi:hypothetical protein
LQLASEVFATTSPPLELADDLKQWIGTIGYENFKNSNLFLLATSAPRGPGSRDDDHNALRRLLTLSHFGLVLSGRTVFDQTQFVSGVHGEREPSIRQFSGPQQSGYLRSEEILGAGGDPITVDALQTAWMIVQQIDEWNSSGSAWRIKNVLRNFVETRANRDIPNQIHQFCRCIEGFILPDAGNTKRQFKSRTELFIGPSNHDLMGKIYDVRSAVEHLHHQKLFEPAGRDERLELARQTAIVEAIARGCLTRLLSKRCLWPHFPTDDALQQFWRLTDAKRRELWGPATPIKDLIPDFRGDWITDEQLGLPGHR